MNMRTTVTALLLGILMAPLAHAEPPKGVQIEVSFLLGYIEGSGCAFYRNGTWYDSKAAQEHLREKYKYLAAGNLVNTAEDFIERAATQSSFSGRAYQVRCNGGATLTSSQWLRDELARLRAYK